MLIGTPGCELDVDTSVDAFVASADDPECFATTLEQLLEVGPGPAAMVLLCAINVDSLDADARLVVLRAWEEQDSWLQAKRQHAMVAVAGATPANNDDWARDEVSCALRLSNTAAGNRIHAARMLCTDLAPTLTLLEDGALSWRHALTMVDACLEVETDVLPALQERVLPKAAEQTPPEFRRAIRRAIAKLAPVEAAVRHETAKAARRVDLYPERDGMATLVAKLPAVDAQAVFTALDKAARAAETVDEHGVNVGIDARRADALVDLVSSRLADSATNGDQRARRLARRVGRRGRRSRQAARRSGAQADVQVVIDLPTLLGLAENPAELAGYGPIPAGVARDLAGDARWRRLVTDEVRGHLLDYGRTTYVPPEPLRAYVKARDRHCVFPGCHQPAYRTDIDHRVPFNKGGDTSSENCALLCRRHHRLKTHAGWQLKKEGDGTLTWISRAGARYNVGPPPQLE